MRILYLTPGCFDKGGISRYSRYQVSALREIAGAGNVRVLSVHGPTSESFEEPFDVEWFAGGVDLGQKAAFVARTFREALAFRPSIVWSALVNLSAIARAIAGLLPGTTTVLNVYGLEMWSGWRASNRWGWGGMGRIVSDCHFTARFLREEKMLGSRGIDVVWDCVDLDRFFPQAPSRETLGRYGIPDPGTGVNLLTLGRMGRNDAHKGYERLLDAFSDVARSIPELRLLYGGGGDLVDVLRRKAQVLGLADRVFFTGFIHEKDLADVYRSAHIFSLVTDRGVGRGEGIPLTPLEAAACGVPILVGNQDGSQEAVVDKATGFLLDPFDRSSHAAAISLLAGNQEMRRKMGTSARKRVEEEFAFPIFVEKHHRLLERWIPEWEPNGRKR